MSANPHKSPNIVVERGEAKSFVRAVPTRAVAGVGHWVKRGKRRVWQGRIFSRSQGRSAIRDLVRAGVGEAVAMTISGHKTASVFKRYNITDEDDKRAALTAAAKYREEQKKKVAVVGQS